MKYICLILIFCTYSIACAQEPANKEIFDFVELFPNCDDFKEMGNYVNEQLNPKYVNSLINTSFPEDLILNTICMKRYEFGYTLFIYTNFPLSDVYDVAVVWFDSNRKSKTYYFGDNTYNLDETANDFEISMINDTIFEVNQMKYDFTFKNVLEKSFEYYSISGKGITKIQITNASLGRIFTDCSIRVIKLDEFKNLSKGDLEIMRNEIFADHGYIFKTKKWKEYFKKQAWYNPRFDDVTDKITIIEKINIYNILKTASE